MWRRLPGQGLGRVLPGVLPRWVCWIRRCPLPVHPMYLGLAVSLPFPFPFPSFSLPELCLPEFCLPTHVVSVVPLSLCC